MPTSEIYREQVALLVETLPFAAEESALALNPDPAGRGEIGDLWVWMGPEGKLAGIWGAAGGKRGGSDLWY